GSRRAPGHVSQPAERRPLRVRALGGDEGRPPRAAVAAGDDLIRSGRAENAARARCLESALVYSRRVVSEENESGEAPAPKEPRKKKSEGAQQLAAAEEAAKARFEKAMADLREGAYRFSSKVRGQTDIVLDE